MTGPHARPWLARVETANSLFLAAFFLLSFHSLHQEHFATPFFSHSCMGWGVCTLLLGPPRNRDPYSLSTNKPRVYRKRYLSGGRASNVLLEPAGRSAKLSSGHSYVVYDYGEGVMGKFSRSWQLVMQSFAILRSDKQLMLFPVLSAVSCFVVTAMIATGGAFLLLPVRAAAIAAGERFNPNHSPMFLLGMFTLYVVNYFVIVFFNVALVGVANSRLMGGTWTFRDGIELAWERKGTILQWALVAATVGVILRTLEERLGLIGRLIMRIIGIVWTLACYFVVPVLAFEDLTPIEAVKRSSKLFRDTWGEKVMGGFSLSMVSMVLMLPGIGLWLAAMFLGGITGLIVGTVLMILYFLLLSVFMSAVGGIFNAALYRYACFKQVPPAFDHDLIASAWAPKS